MPIRLNLKAGNALELAFPDSLLELTTKSTPFIIGFIIPDTHREKLFKLMQLIFGKTSHKTVYKMFIAIRHGITPFLNEITP